MAYLLIGKVIKPFGIKGDLKVDFYVDYTEEVEGFSAFFIKDKFSSSGYKEIKFDNLRLMNDRYTCRINGVKDRNEAELWRNIEIYIDESDLPDTDEGQFYIKDLMDAEVFYQGEKFGIVNNVMNITNQTLLMIKKSDGKEICIPFKDEHIGSVDVDAKKIEVKSIEDLL